MGASAALSYDVDRGAEILRFLGHHGGAPLLASLSRLLASPGVVELTREAAMRQDESDYGHHEGSEERLSTMDKVAREQVRAWCASFLKGEVSDG